jgi:hypothetical protein
VGNALSDLHFHLGISQSVSAIGESHICFRYVVLIKLFGPFPNVSQHRFGHFLSISLKAACFCLLKIEDAMEYFKS